MSPSKRSRPSAGAGPWEVILLSRGNVSSGWNHVGRWRRGREDGPDVGRGSGFFWPLPSDPCCTLLSLHRQAGLGLSTEALRASLQGYGRALLQGHSGVPRGSYTTGRRQGGTGKRISGPNASHTEGLPSEAGGGQSVESEGTSPLPKGLLFLQPGLAGRAAQVVKEGAKERKREKKKKGNEKNQWLKYSVSQRVGWGCPGPAQEASSPHGGASTRKADVWQMASVWGAQGRLAMRWQAGGVT